MKPLIGPRKARRFWRTLDWLGRFQPEPVVYPSDTGMTLPPRDGPRYAAFKEDMIRMCREEQP